MPKITNCDLDDRGVEYPCEFPGGLAKIMIKLRSPKHGFRVAYARGGTKRTDYITIEPGGVYWEDGIQYFPKGLDAYVRCPDADNQIAEILTWP